MIVVFQGQLSGWLHAKGEKGSLLPKVTPILGIRQGGFCFFSSSRRQVNLEALAAVLARDTPELPQPLALNAQVLSQ